MCLTFDVLDVFKSALSGSVGLDLITSLLAMLT